jgi:ferredoxin
MPIESLKLVCFSPTGTTRTIARSVARGINRSSLELVDLTKPEGRRQRLQTSESDLLVVAVPVYIGRVPSLLLEWLHGLEARRTPTVCIVVYGNRAYDDALLELRNILIERGCVPIACAAYVGEHSFSSPELPTAAGRPDASDLEQAQALGRRISEKLRAIPSAAQAADIEVPGSFPYRGDAKLWNVDFISVGSGCSQCGACAAGCPMGAISPDDSRVIDTQKCITCCACIKGCPRHARAMKPSPVKDAAMRVNRLYGERKEPVFFI